MSKSGEGRATIRDVAKLAGVSHQTVSRVINGSPDVRAGTRARVMTAMEQLDYRPSRIAQSLSRRHTRTIGLVVPNIANPYYADVALGAQYHARAHDYNLFLCNTGWDPDEELHVLNTLAAQRVDGIILHGSRCFDEDLRRFTSNFRPVILSGRDFAGPGITTASTDDLRGATLALEHLMARGHRQIGLLVGPETAPTMSNARRQRCFRQAMAECGLALDEAGVERGDLTVVGGYEAALRLLTRAPEVTALLAHNDIVAIGAIKACQTLGRRVPQDTAIVGFSDIDLAAMVTPALTTVRVDRYTSGTRAIARMLDMIAAPDAEYPPILTPANQLIVRDSA